MQGFDMWWIYLGYLVKADLPPGEFEARGAAHAKKEWGWSDTGRESHALH